MWAAEAATAASSWSADTNRSAMPASARRSSSSRRIVRLLEQLRLQRAAEVMAERERHRVSDADRKGALAHAAKRGLELSGEQRTAFEHMTGERDLGVVLGYAGTGKSAMLRSEEHTSELQSLMRLPDAASCLK